MTDTLHLQLPLLDSAQAQKHVTHNEALMALDALVHLSVIARDVSAPPSAPPDGGRWIVATAAVAAFAGQGRNIALFEDGAWRFFVPQAGWRAHVESESAFLVFDGSAWKDIGQIIRSLDNLGHAGIGTSADADNPFAVKANAALFTSRSSGEGGSGDFRFKLNKSAAGNSASQLYQTGYSGRAETGLIGNDRFAIKVSPDGTSWYVALDVDPASGQVSFPGGISGGGLNALRGGNGAPAASLGINGDYYIDGANARLYGPKASGAWGSYVSLTGSAGAAGSQILATSGTPSSGTGANGDYAIDATAAAIYGPKAAGSWPNPVWLRKRVIYVDPTAGSGGYGSKASPWNATDATAALAAGISDPVVEMVLLAGVHRGSYIFDSTKQREVAILAPRGKQTQIFASKQVTSGWTQHGTYTNLWYRTLEWNWAAATGNNGGGAIDVSAGQSVAHWTAGGSYSGSGSIYAYPTYAGGAAYSLPFRNYYFTSANTSLSTLNSSPYACTADTTNHLLYINTNGVNPNTLTFELPQAAYGIGFTGASGGVVSDSAENTHRIWLEGIESRYGYSNNFWFERAAVEGRNLVSQAAWSNHGFAITDCSGRLDFCRSLGNYGDGFNNNGQNASTFPVPPVFTFNFCEGHGAISGSGDGFSNHQGQYTFYHGCKADGNFKNGFSPVDSAWLTECYGLNNGNAGLGMSCSASVAGFKPTLVLKNFRAKSNYAGLLLGTASAAASGSVLSVRIESPLLTANVRGIYIISAATADLTGEIIDPKYAGNTGFTIATLAQSSIAVTNSFTTS